MIVINANNLILGRISAKVAKLALLGESIKIVNCEKTVITGDKKSIIKAYKRRMTMGIHTKGPFLPRMPDRFVKRTIRGMLPYKNPRGAEALKRIICYAGVPEEFAKEKQITYEEFNVSKIPYLKFITVKDLCKVLGAKE
jgi:large subunit ribosomal protein L13